MTNLTTTGTGQHEDLLADLARMQTTPAGPGTTRRVPAGSWVTHLQAERKAPATIRLYATGVAAFTAWHQANAAPGMPVTVGCLDRKTALAFLADVLAGGAAPATARARHAALRRFSAWLAEDGATDGDVLLALRPPKADQAPVDSLDRGELAALIKACRPRPGRTGGRPSRRCGTRPPSGCSRTPACAPGSSSPWP